MPKSSGLHKQRQWLHQVGDSTLADVELTILAKTGLDTIPTRVCNAHVNQTAFNILHEEPSDQRRRSMKKKSEVTGMKSRGRRRERGLIRSVSSERLADSDKQKGDEVLGPIAQSRTIQGSGQRKRHIVTYRQESWPRVQPPAVQPACTEESSLSVELNELDGKESANDSRVIKLTANETGAYVSRPSTFCNIFETSYLGIDDSTKTQESHEHASDRLVFCPEQVDASFGCDSFGMMGTMVELSFGNWFSYPNMPFLEHTSSGESNSSKEESLSVSRGTTTGR